MLKKSNPSHLTSTSGFLFENVTLLLNCNADASMGRIPVWCISVLGRSCNRDWLFILLPTKIITVLFVVWVWLPDIIACAYKAVQQLIPCMLELCARIWICFSFNLLPWNNKIGLTNMTSESLFLFLLSGLLSVFLWIVRQSEQKLYLNRSLHH